MNPKHIKEITETDRIANAPYNFVELPEKVVAAEDLPSGDRYHPNKNIDPPRYTGRIECTITTESLLYTRCGWHPDDFAKYSEPPTHKTKEEKKRWEKEEKAKWEKERREILAHFFSYPGSSLAAIPGSSIRGMLRTLVEIASFSKIDRVTDNKLFYRSLGDPALKQIYSSNFVEPLGDVEHPRDPKAPCYRAKVHTGFLRKRNNYYVIEECGSGRIHFDLNNPPTTSVISTLSHHQIYQTNKKVTTPNWQYQDKTIYVDIDQSEQDYFFPRQTNRNGKQRHPNLYLRFRTVYSASFTDAPNLEEGTLVITGDMQHKHLEFVFLNEKLKEYLISDEMVRRFQDDDQVTKWQEKAYPKDKPFPTCRQQDGYLRDGEPVFFLLNDDEESVRFFGRAQMFRLPYECSPLDFVPPKLKDAACTDIAEAIFGYVDGKQPREKARASRVFITDGVLKPNQDEKIKECQQREAQSILLSSPKPTTFQHYLVQPDVNPKQLKHYASQPPTKTEKEEKSGETVIRGHKLYWHKPAPIETPSDASDTQTSLIKPIDPGIEFTFTIHFENLSNVELGALLWVLSLSSDKSQTLETGKLDEKYCFSLGMGKPLGMGAVKIDYELHMSDRTSRYSHLFDGTKWKTGEEDQSKTAKKEEESVKAFEKYVLDGICCEDYPKTKTREQLQHLKELPRIEMLLAMLRCDNIPDAKQSRYMELEKFKNRKVLPTPLDVMKISDNRRFYFANSPSKVTTESQSTEPPKNPSNLPKPKPKKNSDSGQYERGGNVDLAFQRPPKKPKR
ncbi:TIGR03986 family CRISPR-associated RAMP protein [Microcoleus sp. ARI1-B5]|uniref:TIGR03986 family type III CRISPR-associated RAMP protein n=1 Tax=unclassified Microcoleus TaxID=2642155 RepID=UPI002FD161B9